MPLPIASSRGLSSKEDPDFRKRYHFIRQATEILCEPLETEDYGVQSMPDASPVKWHLAHTTWFFETFLLKPHQPGYQPFHPQFGFLFNSYYDALGSRWLRAERGLMVRPTVAEVFRYRAHVDEHIDQFLFDRQVQDHPQLEANLLLGLHHEQQHQELLLTDLKHAWAANPLQPEYRPARAISGVTPPHCWQEYSGGLVGQGHDGPGFAFDNESPRHKVFLQPFRLASRLVTNGEYKDFIEDGENMERTLLAAPGD